MDRFSVDTQLFRELGELLVGRDSTALVELIKNAYDADATSVTVIGRNLDRPEQGSIRIVDDGVGMTPDQFRRGYLTIAGRSRTGGERRSLLYGRRYTGEKGIGRLATHKLAHLLAIRSVPFQRRQAAPSEVSAKIDWDAIEKYETIDKIGRDALTIDYKRIGNQAVAGTSIELTGLRHAWTPRDLGRFVAEMGLFQPPPILVSRLPDGFARRDLLLDDLPVRDSDDQAPFVFRLEGDLAIEEDLWTEVTNSANWVVEIASGPGLVRIAIAPTSRTQDQNPKAAEHFIELPDVPTDQPVFTARVIAREGARGVRRTGQFVSQAAGVRVYMEGFRVASYGEQGDDWLGLDRDYSRRTPALNLNFEGLPVGRVASEGLRGLPNNAYVGAVLLTHSGVKGLQMLANREGFLETEQFDRVRDTVRVAIDLLTRVRASYGVAPGSAVGETALLSDELRLRDGLVTLTKETRVLRRKVSAVAPVVQDDVDALVDELHDLSALAERAVADRSLLRVLAAAGTQMAAFIHETQGLVGSAHSVARSLAVIAEDYPDEARRLNQVREVVEDLANRIHAQATYLADVTSVEVRRRRTRVSVKQRFEKVLGVLSPAAERLEIELVDAIDPDARTAAMYPAEVTVVLTNLMTNAIKAAGGGGRVRVFARRDEEGLRIRVSNTGRAVDPSSGDDLFRPFVSTTTERVDPLLGQGMGLGLPITRSIVEEYKGSIKFSKAQRSYATTVTVRLP